MIDYIDSTPCSVSVYQISEMDVAITRLCILDPSKEQTSCDSSRNQFPKLKIVCSVSITRSFSVMPTRDITPCWKRPSNELIGGSTPSIPSFVFPRVECNDLLSFIVFSSFSYHYFQSQSC